uniref:Uncharacterized protein n=1 Tax=Arundo donax TaxID=35708 RepID=A0A0A8ZIS2_ARUDO
MITRPVASGGAATVAGDDDDDVPFVRPLHPKNCTGALVRLSSSGRCCRSSTTVSVATAPSTNDATCRPVASATTFAIDRRTHGTADAAY